MSSDAERKEFEARISKKYLRERYPDGSYKDGSVDYLWKGYLIGTEAATQKALQQTLERGIGVAVDVGGEFWKTHRLNTGLLKFLAAIRAEAEKGNNNG